MYTCHCEGLQIEQSTGDLFKEVSAFQRCNRGFTVQVPGIQWLPVKYILTHWTRKNHGHAYIHTNISIIIIIDIRIYVCTFMYVYISMHMLYICIHAYT